MGEAGERIRKIDEKVLQNPARILRPNPLLALCLPWKRKPPQRTKNKRGNEARASFSHKGTKVHLRVWRGRRRGREKERKSEAKTERGKEDERTGSSILPLADIYSVNRQTDGQTMMLIARWTKASIA